MQLTTNNPGSARNGVTSPELAYIGEAVKTLRATFESGKTRPYAFRMQQLDALLKLLDVECDAITDALHTDLGKPRLEAWGAEVSDCAAGIKHLKKHLKKWMKPERVATSLVAMPGKSRVVREPLGVGLIITPWNYPFSLAINPLAGALAAGNCVMIKPSEVAPATSALLARLIPKYFDPSYVKVIEGAVTETTEVLVQRFDHIFYTGNGTVGRIVMAAAAKHLTPVTLELGGKSPCIVDEHGDMDVQVRRIMWAKGYNCGQTCVAPDYVLVHKNVHDKFIETAKRVAHEFWGDNPQASKDYGRIVNVRHHRRLMALLPGSGEVVVGGTADEASRFIAPTVLKDVPENAPVMREEIFGPILPVIKVDSIEHAIQFIRARPKPLALYLFSSSEQSYQAVVHNTSSGGLIVNHAIMQVTVPGLPFGGVGESGMGAYHGKHSFEAFSHRKAVLKKGTALDPSILYPPYTASKEAWMRRLM